MRVFVAKGGPVQAVALTNSSCWDLMYEKHHKPSMSEPVNLFLNSPVVLKPGEVRGIYVHSARRDDTGIVYDQSREGMFVQEDGFLKVLPHAVAHLNSVPFLDAAPWGWGHTVYVTDGHCVMSASLA
eukprot:m.65630 g.65630  ORF g.65630 m.65630 type:complete len:127 (-) comp15924_c0_seq11:1538-1918(-)